MKTTIATALIIILLSCKERNIFFTKEWNPPVVVDTLPISDKEFQTFKINNPINEYIYIGQENDSIFITKNSFNLDLYYSEFDKPIDSLQTKNGLEVIPDIKQSLTIDQANYSLPPPPMLLEGEEYEIDERKTDSIYEIWKNRPRNYVNAFPVFIKNSSKDSISIDNQDGRLFVIQEAKNPKGIWKPIEYWMYSDCGNSYATTSIGPKDIIIIKKIKYAGSFKTDLRLKFKTENKIIYSQTFKGSINEEQFDLTNIDPWIKKSIDDKDFLDAIFFNN